MKPVTVLLVSLLTLGLLATPPGRAQTDGKAVFIEKKCNNCHSVDSEGIASLGKWPVMWTKSCEKCTPDLSTVGERRKNPDWLRDYLKGKKSGRNGFKHNEMCVGLGEDVKLSIGVTVRDVLIKFDPRDFPLFTDKKDEESLNVLVAWLMTLKEHKE